MNGPRVPDHASLRREIGWGLLAGVVSAPLMFALAAGGRVPRAAAVFPATVAGGACAGALINVTRIWAQRWPRFAVWRWVFVGGVTMQLVGACCTLLGAARVVGLPAWGVVGVVFVGLVQLDRYLREHGLRLRIIVLLVVVGLGFGMCLAWFLARHAT